MRELLSIALTALLLSLLRQLIWCIRWLWRYAHRQETPPPIPFLPQSSGELFEDHIRQKDREE